MQTVKKYRVTDQHGDEIAVENSLLDAVETSFGHDGYGFRMERNAEGAMVAVCSTRHLGNNLFDTTVQSITLDPASVLEDDQKAKDDLARMIYEVYGDGEAHVTYQQSILEVSL